MQTNIITLPAEKSYLISFFNTFKEKKNSKEHIVFFRSFNNLIRLLLQKAPTDYFPVKRSLSENEFIIELPVWKDINTNYYYFISKTGTRFIEDFLYRNFCIIYEMHMNEISLMVGYKKATYLFMEFYNIPESKFDMLIKKDQRRRLSFLEKTKEFTSIYKY